MKRALHLVISGLSAAGKTTLVQALGRLDSVLVVPEHVDWIGGSKNFPRFPENIQQKKDKQRFFMDLDRQRFQWVQDHLTQADIIVTDTDFTSPLAHNYAERWLYPELDVYNWLVDEYGAMLRKGEVGLADAYIYLDVPLEDRKKRRRKDWPARRRNDLFFKEPFPDQMRYFYWSLMHSNSPRAALCCDWLLHEQPVGESRNELEPFLTKPGV